MKQVKCPNCAATMEVQDDREFAFCSYCGTKIMLNETMALDRKDEVTNLINRALEFEERRDYQKAREYCNRVLDIDSKNELARALERRLDMIAPLDNIVIKYVSSLDDKYKLRVTLNGYTWYTIDPNGQISMQLPIGPHNILFSGRKAYTRRISVVDTKKIITITYHAVSRHLNEITVE